MAQLTRVEQHYTKEEELAERHDESGGIASDAMEITMSEEEADRHLDPEGPDGSVLIDLFRELDTNGDGGLAWSEVEQEHSPGREEVFGEAHDHLSQEQIELDLAQMTEYEAMRFRICDHDGDGRLSAREFVGYETRREAQERHPLMRRLVASHNAARIELQARRPLLALLDGFVTNTQRFRTHNACTITPGQATYERLRSERRWRDRRGRA